MVQLNHAVAIAQAGSPDVALALVDRLEAGGRLAGHFFGDRVSGVDLPVQSRHSRAEALTLLQRFEVEVFEEIERDGQTALGAPAHWHIFEVVARKRA